MKRVAVVTRNLYGTNIVNSAHVIPARDCNDEAAEERYARLMTDAAKARFCRTFPEFKTAVWDFVITDLEEEPKKLR